MSVLHHQCDCMLMSEPLLLLSFPVVSDQPNNIYFKVGELRKHQLLEAHVRCYAIRHDRTLPMDSNGKLKESCKPETVHYQTHCMRLQHPNDELGSQLLLVIPQLVVHRIEASSRMMIIFAKLGLGLIINRRLQPLTPSNIYMYLQQSGLESSYATSSLGQ